MAEQEHLDKAVEAVAIRRHEAQRGVLAAPTWDELGDVHPLKIAHRERARQDLQAAAPHIEAKAREELEEERCEECEGTGIYEEGDEWAPCEACDLGRGFAEYLRASRREAEADLRERLLDGEAITVQVERRIRREKLPAYSKQTRKRLTREIRGDQEAALAALNEKEGSNG